MKILGSGGRHAPGASHSLAGVSRPVHPRVVARVAKLRKRLVTGSLCIILEPHLVSVLVVRGSSDPDEAQWRAAETDKLVHNRQDNLFAISIPRLIKSLSQV